MRRVVPVIALLVTGFVAEQPTTACSFCAGGIASRVSLREQFRQSAYVAQGRLKNWKFDPAGGGGSTEFHIERVLKADRAIGDTRLVIIPRYLPVIANTPADHVIFFSVADGKPDALQSVPASAAVIDYLTGAAALDDKDATARLKFYFGNLESDDPAVAGDAFVEMAKTTDAELLKARSALDPAKLRRFLSSPRTPSERLGVYAMMLGLCGEPKDAEAIAGQLTKVPIDERVRENFGGFLAALTLLDAPTGWSRIETILTDRSRPFEQRLAAINVLRFFHGTRADESKPNILKCYRGLIPHGDLADVAIDDLRRWKWWDLTADVLAQFGRPTHTAPIVRKGIVRYALQCPGDEAKRFVAAVRAKDPKLVANVEETLKFFDPVK